MDWIESNLRWDENEDVFSDLFSVLSYPMLGYGVGTREREIGASGESGLDWSVSYQKLGPLGLMINVLNATYLIYISPSLIHIQAHPQAQKRCNIAMYGYLGKSERQTAWHDTKIRFLPRFFGSKREKG